MPVILHIKKHWVTFITSPDYLRPNQIGQCKKFHSSHYEARKHERYAFVPGTSVTWRKGSKFMTPYTPGNQQFLFSAIFFIAVA